MFGDTCTYSHERLKPEEIYPFLELNYDFAEMVFNRRGKTNLGRFFSEF
jgi:hypothetical protein